MATSGTRRAYFPLSWGRINGNSRNLMRFSTNYNKLLVALTRGAANEPGLFMRRRRIGPRYSPEVIGPFLQETHEVVYFVPDSIRELLARKIPNARLARISISPLKGAARMSDYSPRSSAPRRSPPSFTSRSSDLQGSSRKGRSMPRYRTSILSCPGRHGWPHSRFSDRPSRHRAAHAQPGYIQVPREGRGLHAPGPKSVSGPWCSRFSIPSGSRTASRSPWPWTSRSW